MGYLSLSIFGKQLQRVTEPLQSDVSLPCTVRIVTKNPFHGSFLLGEQGNLLVEQNNICSPVHGPLDQYVR